MMICESGFGAVGELPSAEAGGGNWVCCTPGSADSGRDRATMSKREPGSDGGLAWTDAPDGCAWAGCAPGSGWDCREAIDGEAERERKCHGGRRFPRRVEPRSFLGGCADIEKARELGALCGRESRQGKS